ncbi:MAG: 50S ribosomal protein L29 [Candidatus Aenigmatarchaeota archaeon]
MAIIRPKDLRKMNPKDITKKMNELQLELAKERANINIGASVSSPGRLKEIKKTIARMKTLKNEKPKGGKTSK